MLKPASIRADFRFMDVNSPMLQQFIIFKKNIFVFLLMSLFFSVTYGQEVPPIKDSTQIYKNIESYSKRKGFTKFMYNLIFQPVSQERLSKKPKSGYRQNLLQKPYSEFEGKIIRNISIETLDPFGYAIADTVVANQNPLSRFGNKLHVKSQRVTIRNLLLIRQNNVFDSIRVKESERLVRSQKYVNDVLFYVVDASPNSDSVDIFIRELDKWSLTPKIAYSNTRVTVQLLERNFMGWGHDFRNSYTWYHTTGEDAFYTNYIIPNFRNTYISTALHYGTDEYRNFTKSLAFDRPFYSPLARWAGGVNITQQFRKDSISVEDTLSMLQKIKFNAQDYWMGGAVQIFKGKTENERTTNFVSSLRFLRIRYLQKPIQSFDKDHLFSDEDFYLATIGISTRKYVRDRYLFKFGITEDVPIGRVFSITGGYQVKDFTERFYFGVKVSKGNYFRWGYLSSYLEYGTFLRNSTAEQSALAGGLAFFTGLFEVGKWKFRQFVKPEFTVGLNRFASDSITLKDGIGLDGFNSTGLTGTSRILFTLQTQSYAPWDFIGFRFGPYFIYSMGMLGDEKSGFKNSRLYSQIGIGLLIKNEYLILNTFQISVAFYPIIPGNGNNKFKINSFRTADFGMRDFEIGKPTVVGFE